MDSDTEKASWFTGYRIPFYSEGLAERWFAQNLGKKMFHEQLLIGRQIPVFGGPERLDILAIDRCANLWIYEFKRAVAQPDAIRQLVTYGSFAARLSVAQLAKIYASRSKRRTLDQSFKERFGSPLPKKLSKRVGLVLASFSFSFACTQTVDFMDRCGRIAIGQIEYQLRSPSHQHSPIEWRWLKDARLTDPFVPALQEKDPESYVVLSLDELDSFIGSWGLLSNGIVEFPDIAAFRDLAIEPGTAIFLHVRNFPCDEFADSDSGLVGYGIVTGKPFDIRERPEALRIPANALARLNQESVKCRVLPVKWLNTSESPLCINVPLPPGIFDSMYYVLADSQCVHDFKDILGVESLDPNTSLDPNEIVIPGEEFDASPDVFETY
jgi:hypothetical protein